MQAQSELSPSVLAVVGAFLVLPTILFASVGLWAPMAAGIVCIAYFVVMAVVKWRKSGWAGMTPDTRKPPPIEPWPVWLFLVVMVALTAISLASAQTALEWVGLAVLVAGLLLAVWVVVVVTRRERSGRS